MLTVVLLKGHCEFVSGLPSSHFGFDTTKADVFSAKGEGDIRIVQNDLTALNCMQLLTKLCEGLWIIKGKVGAECFGQVWFLTPHPCNHPLDCLTPLTWQTGVILIHFQTSGQTKDLIALSKLNMKQTVFKVISPFLCFLFLHCELITCFVSYVIKYSCRVNDIYNMKLANQSVNNHYLFIVLLKSSCSGHHHRSWKSAEFPSHPMERSPVCPHYTIYPQVESCKSFCFVHFSLRIFRSGFFWYIW